MPAFVNTGHHADLDDAQLGVLQVLFQPVGADQELAGSLGRLQQGSGGQQAGAEEGFDLHCCDLVVVGSF
jgi:hypothetical protein